MGQEAPGYCFCWMVLVRRRLPSWVRGSRPARVMSRPALRSDDSELPRSCTGTLHALCQQVTAAWRSIASHSLSDISCWQDLVALHAGRSMLCSILQQLQHCYSMQHCRSTA